MPGTSSTRPSTCLQVGVGAGDDAAVQVAGAGGGVRLEHLGDRLEVLDHVVEATLGDLEGDEGQHLVAHRLEVEVGIEAADDPALLELVEAGLYRSPGDPELAGQLHHPGSWGLAHRLDQLGVEGIDSAGQHEQDVYQS